MANTLYNHAESNTRKTVLLFTVFFVLIIAFGFLFARVFNSPVILLIAVIFSVSMSFASYWYSDKMVLAMSGAKEIKKQDAPELYRIVENLSMTVGAPMPKIYIINERAPNAFATGRNAEHAVVAVTQGLLEKLEKRELEGVLAHELSHIKNKDMLVSTVAVVLVGFLSILSDWFMRMSFFGGFRSRNNDRENGQAGAILMIIGFAVAILAPIAGMLMQLAISRKREFLADASGALVTRDPEGLAFALQKIASDTQAMRSATNATAHLYFENPFKADAHPAHAGRASFIVKLFMTHPPVEERIRALRKIENRMETE
ncbi:MAG: M48 family metallopeptidase [Parcubacteria group bacterium]|nr:M48 family metallopeptidase [Parcubacteria group bacterium]